MSATRTKTIAVLGSAVLAGCQLVAGIQDLTYSEGAQEGGVVTPGGDATTGAGTDAATAEASGDGAGSSPSNDAPAEVADAPSGVIGDAGPAADSGSAGEGGGADGEAGATDAATGEEATGDGGESAAEAGVVSYTVPIPEPDGGPLLGSDGGAILGELIDDIDTEVAINPGWILPIDGRTGTWFTYDDGTVGGIVPSPNSPPSASVGSIVGWDGNPNNSAAHATGNGRATYAGTGFNLAGGFPMSYDASAYQGFVFWGRIGGDSGSVTLKFEVPDRNTSAMGGVCPDAGTGCGDYFAKAIVFTPTWQQFVIYYDELMQAGYGLPKGLTGLDAAHIYSCQFQPSPGVPFDIWIDDIYFIDN